MPRDLGSPVRPLTVWLAVSFAAASAVAAVPGAWTTARAASGVGAVTDLVVATCALALALALAWLWLITTATVLDLLRGRTRAGSTTRRLVLLACGVAVVAAAGTPAGAAEGDGRELLAGLSLPERAVAPVVRRTADVAPAPTAVDTHVVRPGDSLSSIALEHPGAGSLDERWRAIWRANRDVVGADPDLILPGQVLRLPHDHTSDHTRDQTHDTKHDTKHATDQDGDR